MSVYKIRENSKLKLDNFNIEKDDLSLNSQKEYALENDFKLNMEDFNQLFFNRYDLGYISDYFQVQKKEFRVVTHPKKTNTCYEKALMYDAWDPLNIIKALYFESPEDGSLYAVVVPETGCFIDKSHLKKILDFPEDCQLRKAKKLPENMTFGTCSPFLRKKDLMGNGGTVKNIIFDAETLITKKHENSMDDFSFGVDHRMSVQMNYYQCFNMLKKILGNAVAVKEILALSFRENLVRVKGRIKINYEFNTLNYRTAAFINSIHGYGDVSIENDYIDELDLPDILTISNGIQP